MNAMVLTRFLSLGLMSSALVCCATIRETTAATKDTAAKLTSRSGLADLADTTITRWLPGDRVKVVEVREKDLKELPTGKEKAIAHRKSGVFRIFGGPVDFKEPALPVPGAELDGSLLPPLMP